MLIQRRRIPRPERDRTGRSDPYYGHGYRPDWPSILSVAHDESDGGRLFVITDRPCVIVPGPLALPISVAGLSVLSAAAILPVKFRLQMSGPVPQGSAWAWGTGASSLIDPISNHAPNPASGHCDDVPGPYAPPAPPANVVSTGIESDGFVATLTFDRALVVAGGPDGSILFDGQAPAGLELRGGETLAFTLDVPVSPGSTWEVSVQPAFLVTPLTVPQGGNL